MSITLGRLIVVHDTLGRVYQVMLDGQPMESIIQSLLSKVTVDVVPFKPDKSVVSIPSELHEITTIICHAGFELKTKFNNPCLAAYFASYYFERLTPHWSTQLASGQHILAARFWEEIISKVIAWEKTEGKTIHKGTPYFFLAETYILCGDLESGFIYASNAVEDDKKLGVDCPVLNYPQDAPIYMTLTLRNDKRNHMYSFVKEIRDTIEQYITGFNKEFGTGFKISEIDTKFLSKMELDDIKYFFVFTLWTIVNLRRKTTSELLKNDFSRLKNLDTIFNLCLVVDKILESSPTIGQHYISENVIRMCNVNNWMQQSDLETFQKSYNVAQGDPDQVLPKLLSGASTYQSKPVRKEVLQLLILWNLRNYGGHRIKQQSVLVDSFDNIVAALMNCFFMSVRVLP